MPKPEPRFPDRVVRSHSSAGAPGKGDAHRAGESRERFEEGYDEIDWGRAVEPCPSRPLKSEPSPLSAFERWWLNPANQMMPDGSTDRAFPLTMEKHCVFSGRQIKDLMRRAFFAGRASDR